jgi:hypothetical protein
LPDIHGNRTYGPPFLGGESGYFLSVNCNKRSCAIDLKSPAGKELVRRLAGVADVVIENFRPGTIERLGLGYESLSQYNRRLILCAISGFGLTGPDANWPGYDLIVQGESGVMDITGDPSGPPLKVGTAIADLVTGLYAPQAVLATLRQRDRTGCGGRVDVAMLDAMASLLTFNAGIYFATGKSPQRRGNVHPTISPYETFEAADGSKLWKDGFQSHRLFCGVEWVDAAKVERARRTRRAGTRVSKRDEMDKIVFARIGAVFYVLWGLLHYDATYNVYRIGLAVSPGLAQARLFQDAFYIFAFATTGIVLAIKMNWHNSEIGFWLNALIIGVADLPFILFVLIPDYAPFRSGVLGVGALIFTGLGQTRPIRVVSHQSSAGPEAWGRPGAAAARILEELDEVVRKSHRP